MAVGKLEFRQRLSAICSAGGHWCGGPSGCEAQSKSRIRCPISWPPCRNTGDGADGFMGTAGWGRFQVYQSATQPWVSYSQTMQQDILVNWSPQETRVAIVENGAVQELHVERTLERGLVGNVYLRSEEHTSELQSQSNL